METSESKTCTSKLVYVRSFDLAAKATGIRKAHIISHYDEEIRLLVGRHDCQSLAAVRSRLGWKSFYACSPTVPMLDPWTSE